MNKNAIKKFAIEARKKLIDSVTDKAGMLGITKKSCSKPVTRGTDFEVYQTIAGTEVTLNRRQCEQRRRLVSQIESRGFEAVIEEVAYTWFNRICAIRFMEVNDYLPNRVRVLSSEKEGKMEPDLVTQAPDVDLDLTAPEKEEIIIFIDEIESALHPKAVCQFLDMIDNIANEMGLQVFITSHSYFVIKKLFLIALKKENTVKCI